MRPVRFLLLAGNRLKLNRSAMVLAAAALAGLAAAWSARQHIQTHVERLEADARTPVVARVVAAHDLPAGTRISADHLASRSFPAGLVPSDSVDAANHARLAGMILRSPLRAGDLVLPVHGRVSERAAFSSHLGDGRRAVTMPVDAINSVSGLLEPGDLIDLYVSFEHQRRRITAPLLQGVLVLATGAQTQSAAGQPGQGFSTVTLDTSPEDAVKLVAARQSGTITAILRHPGDDRSSTKAVRGDLATLLGVANQPPRQSSSRAPVLYGNRSVRNVPKLAPDTPVVRNPGGVFDLPQVQKLVSAWLPHHALASMPADASSAEIDHVTGLMAAAEPPAAME